MTPCRMVSACCSKRGPKVSLGHGLCLLICSQKLNASNISVVRTRVRVRDQQLTPEPHDPIGFGSPSRVSASTFVVVVSDLAGSAYQRVAPSIAHVTIAVCWPPAPCLIRVLRVGSPTRSLSLCSASPGLRKESEQS